MYSPLMPKKEQWLTATQAAIHAGCSYEGILKRVTRGKVVARREGRSWLILKSSVAPKDKFAINDGRPAGTDIPTGR